MSKITEYTEVTTLATSNIFLIDGPTLGTRKITAKNAGKNLMRMADDEDFFAMLDEVGAPTLHRQIYRGKNLGNSLTAAQKTEIQAGTFKGLWVGDYWVINDRMWVIADFDYWYKTGSTSFDNHHIVVIPANPLFNASMNDENTTAGGYYGSAMRTDPETIHNQNPLLGYLADAYTLFYQAFGSALLTHDEYLINSVSDGKPYAASWYNSTVDLPSETMICGTNIHVFPDMSQIGSVASISNSQLALMMLSPKHIKIRKQYWLRDVVTGGKFAAITATGLLQAYPASTEGIGVRPVAAIG